jgi:hypothetical protein
MQSNSSFENFLDALEKLSSDNRLARVIQGDNACSLHLWLLELTQANTTEYRLLFGWIIPAKSQNVDKWNISDGGKKKNLVSQGDCYKFRIAKLTLHHNSNAIYNLIKGLCQGKTLDESCNLGGIVHPKQPYGQLRLAESTEQLNKYFTVRPVVFLETIETNQARFKELQPINSPIHNASAFAGFLWRIDKLSLFSKNGEEPLPQADELAKQCLLHLTKETGLDFCSTSSKRIGNIEWLSFSAADEKENSLVKVNAKPSTDDAYEVDVEIPTDALPKGTKVLIGCELRNDCEVIFNECKIAEIKDNTTIVSFKAQQAITNILISIWLENKDNKQWEIWYKHSPFLLQGINIGLYSVGLQANLPSDWLQEFINSKVRERVEKAQNIRQAGCVGRFKIGGHKSAPWMATSTEMLHLSQRLFPKPSGGGFFQKGWDADEPGRLRFFEWLQSLTKNTIASKILIIDPYFDASGITELIARAEATDTEYVVLTNTQVKSDDDSPELESGKEKLEEPQRAKLLKQVCKQVELLLNNLKFQLLDLRSKEGGKTQLFHDRYILVFDESSYIQSGYHLSNSLQGATKKHPLLITPIPEPELTEVEEYVSGLLASTDDSTTEVITLFSSVKEIISCCTERQQGVANIPYAGLFFTALLNENLSLNIGELETFKYNQHDKSIFDESGNLIVPEDIESKLDHLTQVLISSDAGNFAKLWTALGAWLARITDSHTYLDQIISAGGENLAVKIQNFLSDAPEQETPIGLLGTSSNSDSARISNLILRDFKEGLHHAKHLLTNADSHSWYCFWDDWGIQYAAKALVQVYPDKLVSVISQLVHLLNTNESSYKYWGLANTLTSIIKQLLDQLILIQVVGVPDNGLLTTLLRSDVHLLRAIASNSLSPSWNKQTDLQNSFAVIDILQKEIERIYALAQWVFEIRIRANVKNHQEDREIQTIRLAIFDKIRQIWSNNLQPEELRDIGSRLSGRGEGNWAISTTNEFLLPLVEENKLTVDAIAQLWLEILYEKLKAHTENKENGKSSYHFFYAIKDEELTNVCGWALANASIECRKSWLEKFKKEIKKPCERVLYRPFSRSRDFSVWCDSYNGLLWLQTLFNFTRLFGTNEKISNSEEDELKQLVIKIDEVLNTNLKEEENLSKDTNTLLEFSRQVKQKLEKQGESTI